MKTLKLKNYFFITDTSNPNSPIENLQGWLGKQMLHGKASRARTRFINLIAPRVKELDEERMKMLTNYAKKKKEKKEVDGKKKEVETIVYYDKDGKETTDKNKGVKFVIQEQEKFAKEYSEYLNEDLTLDIIPSNQETIYGVKDLILNTKEEFGGGMAARYDEWATAFESIAETKK